VAGVKLLARFHSFNADATAADFGRELNLQATWNIDKQWKTQLKYADFDSENIRFPNTRRVWLTVQYKW
jgi:hypothetical protein